MNPTRKNALMILGTASHVGKSILTAGLGRVFSDHGYRVAPFKAQNMSLNSAATPDGGEIGRAQALQAEACRAMPCVEMNPILLKPSTDTGAQVILLGKIWGQITASDYHTRRVEQLLPDLGLDEEDGVALEDRASAARCWRNLESGSARALRIGVIALPHMANFTDFDALALEPSISVAFLEAPEEMAMADLLILPGTKQTLDDLSWLEQRGFDRELRRLAKIGIPIAGICGGFQMLGVTVEDPC